MKKNRKGNNVKNAATLEVKMEDMSMSDTDESEEGVNKGGMDAISIYFHIISLIFSLFDFMLSDQSKKNKESKQIKEFYRSITWNMGHYEGTARIYKKRREVLKENVKKQTPALVKLNEIWGVSKKEFIKFASNILKDDDKKDYSVLALSYPAEDGTVMSRAAAILVRNDLKESFKKALGKSKNGEYSVAGVHDKKNDIYHVSLYIHHPNKTTKKKDNDQEAIEVNSKMLNLKNALDAIKTGISDYMKREYEYNDNDLKKALTTLRIIISGDLNLNYNQVGLVCRKEKKDFIWLKDMLFYQWPTHVTISSTNCTGTSTKIDYVLAANVEIRTHKPIETEYDHFIIIEDVYGKGFKSPRTWCNGPNCEFECGKGVVRGVVMPEPMANDRLDELVQLFKDTTDNCSKQSVFTHYKNWKGRIRQLFFFPVPSPIYGFNILATCLDYKLFGEEVVSTRKIKGSNENWLNWISAVVILLEQPEISVDLHSNTVRSKVNKVMAQITNGRRNWVTNKSSRK